MPKMLDMLDTEKDRIQLNQHLLTRWKRRVEAIRAAGASSKTESFKGQMTLARDFRLVMPLRAARLPIPLRGVLTNIMPLPPARVKRCLRCGGKLDGDGQCTSGAWIWAKVNGRYMNTQCKAVWRVGDTNGKTHIR